MRNFLIGGSEARNQDTGGLLHVLGIDPGSCTGVALYVDGKLAGHTSIKPVHIQDTLRAYAAHAQRVQVVFEDSRLQSTIFSDKKCKNEKTKKAVARKVGRIDAWCELIGDTCDELGVKSLGISPKEKGAKVAPSAYEHVTGWAGRTNEHERDASMIARPFRKGFAA